MIIQTSATVKAKNKEIMIKKKAPAAPVHSVEVLKSKNWLKQLSSTTFGLFRFSQTFLVLSFTTGSCDHWTRRSCGHVTTVHVFAAALGKTGNVPQHEATNPAGIHVDRIQLQIGNLANTMDIFEIVCQCNSQRKIQSESFYG